MVAMTPTPDLLPAERTWVRELFDALEPHMLGDGTYVNVLSEADDGSTPPQLRARSTSGCRMIKSRYDPDNVFHGNANIRPLHHDDLGVDAWPR